MHFFFNLCVLPVLHPLGFNNETVKVHVPLSWYEAENSNTVYHSSGLYYVHF